MRRTIAGAKSLAEARGESSVGAAHFFLSIGDDGCANAVLAAAGVSLRDLQGGLLKFLPNKHAVCADSRFDEASQRLITSANDCARSMNHNFLGDEHLLFALAATSSPVSAVLELRGLTADVIRRHILDLLGPGILGPGFKMVAQRA
jgi:ATP-dependent Clp protease ATP-binding subunit ClpA